MESPNFAEVFVTFLALLGPQKILLSFDLASRHLGTRDLRLLAVTSSAAAAAVGVLCALTAPWLIDLFHLSYEAVLLAGGIILFIYAVMVMFGLHLDNEPAREQAEGNHEHPVASGFRALALPYIVTPLGVTAVLVEALSSAGLAWRSVVAASYVAVTLLDLLCIVLLGPMVRRLHASVRELSSRLLGLLLAGVGMTIVLQGLAALGVLHQAGPGH